MGLELSTLDKPACPYCGSNANERFGLNLEYDQCALIPTNSGSNECVLINRPYSPYLTKRSGNLNNGFRCPVNTEKNRISLAKRLEEIEKTSQEIQIKAYIRSGKVEYCPPGIALGSYKTPFDN
jgi:hypothetical protein